MFFTRNGNEVFWKKWHDAASAFGQPSLVEIFEEILTEELESNMPFRDAGWGNVQAVAWEETSWAAITFQVCFVEPFEHCKCNMYFAVSVTHQTIMSRAINVTIRSQIRSNLADTRREYASHKHGAKT